jgi:hypothetical protein
LLADSLFDDWLAALETRHLADLTFPEVSRGLRALSATYVERRRRIGEGAALSGAGKRAAFALFYGPLHFLLVREIARHLASGSRHTRITDVGCGTGAAGAAWVSASAEAGHDRSFSVHGIDRHPWALEEAFWTYRHFGLRARTVRADAAHARIPQESGVILAAFVLNELAPISRAALVSRFVERHRAGSSVLIVEPLARSVTPWWEGLRRELQPMGGHSAEWRFRTPLPSLVARLDRAAGLDHRELSGRFLWLP